MATTTAKKKGIHFAWFVLIGVLLMMGLCRGGINSGMGLFFQPISADMHIGVGEVAMMSSISALITMFWSPFAGRLLDKFDIRIITVVAVAIQAGCFAALSLVDAVWGFYALAGIMAFGSVFATQLVGPTMINRWFKDKNGLAMGIMITYGSYLDKKSSLTQSVARIGGFDIGVSFLAGLMIVPAAFVAMGSGEAVAANSGPSLMFVILPTVFADMGGAATVVGFLFFLLVLFAALTSAISLTETCTSIVQDGAGWSRKKALCAVIGVVAVAGIFVNLGYNGLSFIEPMGEGTTLLDFFDFISNSVIMPIVALLTCIFVGWIIKPKAIVDEVKISSEFKVEKAWTVIIKYVAPVLVVVILVAFVAQTFGLISF